MTVVWCYVLFMMEKWCFSNIDGGSIVFPFQYFLHRNGEAAEYRALQPGNFPVSHKDWWENLENIQNQTFLFILKSFDVDILQVCKFWACHKKKIATVATSEGAVLPPTMSGLHPIHQTRQDVISSMLVINLFSKLKY